MTKGLLIETVVLTGNVTEYEFDTSKVIADRYIFKVVSDTKGSVYVTVYGVMEEDKT